MIDGCYLKINTKEIRDQIRQAGLEVCPCCAFKDAIWLTCSSSKSYFEIHGVGYYDELDNYTTPEGAVKQFLAELEHYNKNYLDCGEDVELFIKTCKEIKMPNTEV